MPVSYSAIHGRRLEALRDCAANPKGLPPSAHPTVMPTLIAMGLVERRTPSSNNGSLPFYYLTDAGREAIKALGTGDFEN